MGIRGLGRVLDRCPTHVERLNTSPPGSASERIPTDPALSNLWVVVVVPVRGVDERRWFEAARAGDGHAREQLIENYMPLARHLARRYPRSSEPIEDLEQVACLALVRAFDGFDPARGTAFSSYAVPCISGAIKRHFRDHGWAVRVPRELQELALRIKLIDEERLAEIGRHPTVAELAEAAGVDVEAVLEAREAHHALQSESLDRPRGSDEDEDSSLVATLGQRDPELARVVDRAGLDGMLALLDERDRTIVELYYREELTQSEIGERLGYSQMHVSRLLRAAVARLEKIAPPAGHGVLDRAA